MMHQRNQIHGIHAGHLLHVVQHALDALVVHFSGVGAAGYLGCVRTLFEVGFPMLGQCRQ